MSDQYKHHLASDQRYRVAQATNESRGTSYHRPPEREHSSWWLVALAAGLVAVALWGLKHYNP